MSSAADELTAAFAQVSLSSDAAAVASIPTRICLANILHRSRRGHEIGHDIFRKAVVSFLASSRLNIERNQANAPHTIIFPITLSANQRKIVHEIATSLGLDSLSTGEGSQRQIRVILSTEGYRDLPPLDGEIESKPSKSISVEESRRWSVEKAKMWYDAQPWLIGCNYIPSSAINQLEMWQPETFDPSLIERECQLAQGLGFNVFRVYLHDLLWTPSIREQFKTNLEIFLTIADQYRIRVILVFFDDCHRDKPIKLGPQPPPLRGIHNSGWLQSPGSNLIDRIHRKVNYKKEMQRLQEYLVGVMRLYREDPRILMWDVYNEPGQNGLNSQSYELLLEVWRWAQYVRPSQPLTACVDGSIGDCNQRLNRNLSDIITFHWYRGTSLEHKIRQYISSAEGRPIICTEYMAREFGTTFQLSLPLFKCYNIGAISWGLVAGKTQTVFNWETVNGIDTSRSLKQYLKPHDPYPEPKQWFHDIYRVNGTPYSEEEVEFIRRITGVTSTTT